MRVERATTSIDPEAIMQTYKRAVRRRVFIVLVLLAAMIGGVVLDLTTGPSGLSASTVFNGIIFPESLSRPMAVIVWDVRLPVALTAILVGAALSLAGAEMQTILDNPLASPFTLGVSSAASLGAALAIVLGLGIPYVPATWVVSGNAFLFSLLSVFLLTSLTRASGAGVEGLLLFGISLVFTFNALVALLQFIATADALQQLVFWGMGSLSHAGWDAMAILSIVLLLTLPFSLNASWKFTALRLGQERARSFGIDVSRLRFFSLLRISLLTATAVAFAGTIGFIGLIGPHIARMLIGEDHRFFLPASALTGALVLSLASIASKIIIPGTILPIGIVTAIAGLPLFMVLVFRRAAR